MTGTHLGHREDRIWPAAPGAYGGRRARRGGRYSVFIPAQIRGRRFSFADSAVATLSEASKALADLSAVPQLVALDAVASNLLRSESAASSRIEGIAVSHKRLARAAHRGRAGSQGADRRATEVLGNVHAMRRAIEIGAGTTQLAVEDIQDIHCTLLRFADDHGIAGTVRDKQNWIGGNDFTPIGAAFVPPPPEQVPELLRDLCGFIGRDDVAPVAQAAIAHAQFENIHPFADGNGRAGRALIYAILRRRRAIESYIPPVSLVLARRRKAYIAGLAAYSAGDVDGWCELFAEATIEAASAAEELAGLIGRQQSEWLERLGRPRSDATVRQIVAVLAAQPVIDVRTAQALTGKSHVAVGAALRQLEQAGILRGLDERRWGRTWECGELLGLVDSFERSVAAG
ncbi:MAG: Fic family protein [Thermoleophilaceae bacterium]